MKFASVSLSQSGMACSKDETDSGCTLWSSSPPDSAVGDKNGLTNPSCFEGARKPAAFNGAWQYLHSSSSGGLGLPHNGQMVSVMIYPPYGRSTPIRIRKPVATVPNATPSRSPRAPATAGTWVSQPRSAPRGATSPKKNNGTDPNNTISTVIRNKTVYHLGLRVSKRAAANTKTTARTANKLISTGTWKVLKIHRDKEPVGPLILTAMIVMIKDISKTML